MRIRYFLFVFAILNAITPALASGPSAKGYGQVPLTFEENRGQADPPVKFLSRGPGYGVFLTESQAILRLAGTDNAIRMSLTGGKRKGAVHGMEPVAGQTNYLTGSDPTRWHTNIGSYKRVRYDNVYRGIDLTYYGNQRQLEYDFNVAPGANPDAIRLRFDGVNHIDIAPDGSLILTTDGVEVRQARPAIYQESNGRRVPVEGGYMLRGSHTIGFRVAAYDTTKLLVIDPVLVYASYFGGSGAPAGSTTTTTSTTSGFLDQANSIAVDAAGNAYITGQTPSIDLLTVNAAQTTNHGLVDAFVLKLDPTGTTVIYSTYLGGSSNDVGRGIAVDTAGNAYITGFTSSSDFPVTSNAVQPKKAALQEAFLVKLDPSGRLAYSTYLGGNGDDQGIAVAVDAQGGIYVTGLTGSTNFPTVNPFQAANGGGLDDVFVTKFTPAGAIQYSTYVGGRGEDQPYGIAVDTFGSAYVTGFTTSTNLDTSGKPVPQAFPVFMPYQPNFGGGSDDAFIFKLTPAGNALEYSTFLGGNGSDNATRVAVRADGVACLTGYTSSTNFPTWNAIQSTTGGGFDAIITCYAPDGQSVLISSYFGGEGNDSGTGIAFTPSGNVYIGGYTESVLIRTVNASQPNFGGGRDGFVLQFDPVSATVFFMTYLGGSDIDAVTDIAVDAAGNPYVAGVTLSTDFPIVNAFQPQNNDTRSGFVARFDTHDIVFDSAFSVPSQGGTSVKTSGNRGTSVFGYATSDSGKAPLNGLALIELKNSAAVTVSENGMPVPPLTTVGRVFIEVASTSGVRSVLSIANPNDDDAAVILFDTDASGNQNNYTTVTVGAHTHFSRFVTDDPLKIPAGTTGTLTYISSIPVAAAAFRTMTNERNDFLISSTPIVDLNTYPTNQSVYIPDVADGSGWTSRVILTNPGEDRVNGEVRFFNTGDAFQPGAPMLVDVGGNPASVLEFDIPPRSFQTIDTTGAPVRSDFPFTSNNGFAFRSLGTASSQSTGFAVATPTGGAAALNGVEIMEFQQNGATVSETGIVAPPLRQSGRMFVEVTSQVRTVLSMVNPNDTDAGVDVFFTDTSGTSSTPVTLTVPAHGQLNQSAADSPLSVASDSTGTLNFTSTVPIFATVLRFLTNESSESLISTTPIADPSVVTNQPVVIPYLSDGAGWKTSVVLVNTTDTETLGEVRFFDQGGPSAGAPLTLGIGDGSATAPVIEYDIPPRSAERIQTAAIPLRSTFPFTNKSGSVFKSTGVAATQTTGYAVAAGAPGSNITGLNLIEHSEGGIVVSDAASLPLRLLGSGRAYVELTTNVKSQVTMVNPTDNDATVNFFFTDSTGASNYFNSTAVAAHTQLSAYISDAPFSVASGFTGTMTFTSDIPLAVSVFRYLTNQNSNTIVSATPIGDLNRVTAQPAVIPQFDDGAGWSTKIFLVNTTEDHMGGEVRFYSQGSGSTPGAPVVVDTSTSGLSASVLEYDIPPRGYQLIQTAGTATGLTVGSIQVVPFTGTNTPHAHAILGVTVSGSTATETSVEAQFPVSSLDLYAESSGNFDAAKNGSVRTLISIANPSASAASVRLAVTSLDGVSAGTSGPITVPPNGQVSLALNQFTGLQNVPIPFQGLVQLTTLSGNGVAAVALRETYNSRGQLLITTTGPLSTDAAQASQLVFPYVTDGNGYTSQVIVMTAGGQATGQAMSGSLNFFAADSSPMNMDELRKGSIYIVPFTGMNTPQAHAVLSLRNGATTILETSVEGQQPGTTLRLYAEASGDFAAKAVGSTQTLLAIANPSSAPASVRLDLMSVTGASLGSSAPISIPPNGQVLKFLNEISGFENLNSFQGFLRLSVLSGSGVTVSGLRALYNSRANLLQTSTGPLYETAASGSLILPYVADSGGYSTRVIVTSGPSPALVSGDLNFFNTDGTALNLDELRVGSVQIVPFTGFGTPHAHVLLTSKPSTVTLFQTAIEGQLPASSLRLYAEASGNFDAAEAASTRASFAIENPAASPASVRLQLRTFDGTVLVTSSPITIPANGQISEFLNQVPGFGSIPVPFQGILSVIDLTGSGITAASFRCLFNEGHDFLATTTGPLNEKATAPQLTFPHIAEGGGYTTKFILVNGAGQQGTTGMLRFVTESGTPLGLTLTN